MTLTTIPAEGQKTYLSLSASHQFFAPCPRGLEGLLREELLSLGAESARETVAGAYFECSPPTAWRVCLWSRLANRVLYPVYQGTATDAKELYAAAASVDWTTHWDGRGTLAVDFSGRNDDIRHTQFGAQTVKDALVDHYRELTGNRPAVDRKSPDLLINARLHKGGVSLAIDFSGHSLHRRGYRQQGGAAPLKENLAAALLIRSDWPGLAARGGSLVDPLCGSGTVVIEAAMMAADVAPGLWAERFGFESWSGFAASTWKELRDEAEARANIGRRRLRNVIAGSDQDSRVVQFARANAARAGCEKLVTFSCETLSQVRRPSGAEHIGLVVTNPPYGERLGEQELLKPLYNEVGDLLRAEFRGWQAALFTANRDLSRHVRLVNRKKYSLFNGAMPAHLLLYEVPVEAEESAQLSTSRSPAWSEGATMFANRLRKNRRRLGKWARREGHECFRLYDADMPEYAVAIDCYGDEIHVAEYQAPAGVSEDDAERRLAEIISVVPTVLEVEPGHVHYKQRRRQRGSEQYQRQTAPGSAEKLYTVREGAAKFLVNLDDYLDTGLFLDHRPLRRQLHATAAGARVLNLYCYTGSMTVHAALGGAASSVSVDLSPRYLQWAKRNLELNAVDVSRHRLVRSDCQEWLQSNTDEFDLIILDPPSFSNSKRTDTTLDIQRDHGLLVELSMKCLAASGRLFFSTNKRGFRMEPALMDRFAVEDLGSKTIDEDFRRRPNIHRCWQMKHQNGD